MPSPTATREASRVLAADLVAKVNTGTLTRAYFESITSPDRARHMEFAATYRARDIFAKNCGWCVPTVGWLDSLARLVGNRSVLEMCAGEGTIASLMMLKGIDWHCTDNTASRPYVEVLGALSAVDMHKPDILFASWIPYGSPLDLQLANFRIPMILVGEGRGGCTGTEELWGKHDVIPADTHDSQFEDVPNWCGVHDFTSLVNWRNC